MDIALKTDDPEVAGGHRLFAYGTLCVREIMERVVGRPHAILPGVLHGFSRRRMSGRPYPGLVPDPDASTRGMLYLGLNDPELAALDGYEGSEYERVAVEVETRHGLVAANVYVVRENCRDLVLPETWEMATFLDQHVGEYLRHL